MIRDHDLLYLGGASILALPFVALGNRLIGARTVRARGPAFSAIYCFAG